MKAVTDAIHIGDSLFCVNREAQLDTFNEKLGMNVPNHIAIILDGNGRWAKKRMMPRNFGHSQGCKVIEQTCRDMDAIGVKYFTIYVFSTENWKRSESEVTGLMKLLRGYLTDCIKRSNKDNMRVRILGGRDELAQDIVDKIDELEEATKNNTGLNFQIALNYGSRDEITRAVRELTKECIEKGIDPDTITEDMISAHLDTRDIPDPDFLIRTSGEKRISNYLLWQCAYSEFDFPEVLWPDFNMDYLIEEIRKYNKRDRRFGGVKEE